MEVERVLFLTGALATHTAVSYALVRGFSDADPRIGIVLGLLPDVDFWFPAAWEWPLVHRGLTHTPLFAAALVAGAYVICRDREVALAVGLGVGSHLAIDSLSPMGIDWLFPVALTAGPGVPVHGLTVTAVLWAVAIGVLAWRTETLPSIRCPQRTDAERRLPHDADRDRNPVDRAAEDEHDRGDRRRRDAGRRHK